MEKKFYIGKMIMAACIVTVLFAVIGGILCVWFSGEARPVDTNVLRSAGDWAKRFAVFFYIGCAFSLIYTILMAFMGENKQSNWIINMLVTIIAGLALAVLFYIYAPSKDAYINIIASAAIFLQGLCIFFIASFFAPPHWGIYNPLKG